MFLPPTKQKNKGALPALLHALDYDHYVRGASPFVYTDFSLALVHTAGPPCHARWGPEAAKKTRREACLQLRCMSRRGRRIEALHFEPVQEAVE